MARRLGTLSTPPIEWIRALQDHADTLERLQMQWRRGNMAYRPLVPEDTEVDDLTEEDWEQLERPETHFLWELGELDDDHARSERIEDVVQSLWDIACRWTDRRGAWCDFRLFGYGAGNVLLFQDGRRCVPGDRARGQATTAEQEDHWRRSRRDLGGGPDWRAMYSTQTRSLEQIIGITQSERDAAVSRATKTLEDNHLAWAQIANAMRDTADFQREQMESAYQMRSGAIQLKARALEGIQRTQRIKDMGEVVKYGIDALIGNVIPFGERLLNTFGNERVRPETFPQFDRAQQAIHYIGATLTETQLNLLFDNDSAAIRAFIGRLRQAEAMPIEGEAVAHIAKLMRLFRSKLWHDVADGTQHLCAAYIIGRVAIYQAASYGEQAEQESTA